MISGSYPPMRCGVGDYTQRLVCALREDGVETRVLTSEAAQHAANGAEVPGVRGMRSWHRRALAPFFDQLSGFQPDAVHIQFPTQGYDALSGLVAMAAHARFRARVPVVVTMHEYIPDGLHAGIYALAALASRIVVVRPQYHERTPALAKALVRRAKIRFIPNASAVPAISLTAAERASTRQELARDAAIVAFFGFSYPHKGVDLLFQIADPARHHLLLIGELSSGDAYHQRLRQLAASPQWKDRVTITGFVEADRAARLLAAADAVVFPYREGGGGWNSSLHAAMSQETFVLITSQEQRGYDVAANVYYARPGDVPEMRDALAAHGGTRLDRKAPDSWKDIARAHRELYAGLVGAAK